MKAARRRNSGTGDLENGWNKSSSLSRNGASGAFEAAAASDFDAVEVEKSLASGVVRLCCLETLPWKLRRWWADNLIKGFAGVPVTNCLRTDEEQRPQRLEAARRKAGSIFFSLWGLRLKWSS